MTGAVNARWPFLLAGLPLLLLLLVPVAALGLVSPPGDLISAVEHPLFLPALGLSARTALFSLLVVVLFGTPLAWWLANNQHRLGRALALLVDLPIVLPPAVVGIALLQTFGRSGLLGGPLEILGWQIPFTTTAVVIAQVVVSAPYYIQSAVAAFQQVDKDQVLVARTLGQKPAGAFLRVVIPAAMPGLIAGAALTVARALGEFGATLLFAGNLPGETQTVPLAIYMALESDVRVAVALSLVLAAAAIFLLFVLRFVPALLGRTRLVAGESR